MSDSPSDELTTDEISFASGIALEFLNIPGTTVDEIQAEAQTALWTAKRAFDSTKGSFEAFAARVIRNALKNLFNKQTQFHRRHEFTLDRDPTEPDLPWAQSGTPLTPRNHLEPVDPNHDVVLAVRASLSNQVLAAVLAEFSDEEQSIMRGIADEKSYSEIGAKLGLAKHQVFERVKRIRVRMLEKFRSMGYEGVDSRGNLATNLVKSPRPF